MTDEATRRRDSGQSWTQIADHMGISVREAKARVEEDKRVRRTRLSETQIAEDRNGLRDMCWGDLPYDSEQVMNSCLHMRKEHGDDGCTKCSCDEFVHQNRSVLPWYRLPKSEDPQYVDPDMKLSGNTRFDAVKLGVQDLRKRWWTGAEMPQPSLKIAIRRQRKKLQAGKKVKKHRDRPFKDRGY